MPGLDEAVPWHYGSLSEEQLALWRGWGVTDLSHLGVVTVSGPDRLSWLTTLSTQVLTDLNPFDSGEALLLDPHGRIRHHLRVCDDGQRTWLITEAGRSGELGEFLESMRFMLRVEVTLPEDTAVLGVAHRQPLEWQQFGALAVWQDPWPAQLPQGASYCAVDQKAHPTFGATHTLLVVKRDALEETGQGVLAQLAKATPAPAEAGWELDGPRWAGMAAWEALRVAAWRPRLGYEVDDKALPHELDWLRTAVHLNKGCYCGQEAVARIINLGKPPRRLVALDLDGFSGEQPPVGAGVFAGERQIGKITSVAYHFELGPIALALVRRAAPAGQWQVQVGEQGELVSAGVQEVVRADGRSDHSPSQRPGAELRGLQLG